MEDSVAVYIKGVCVLVDKQDEEFVKGKSWWITPQGYVCTKVQIGGRRVTKSLHRLLLGDPDCPSIDHINRIKTDNRRINLRCCTDSENNRNRATLPNKTSKYRGVSKRGDKWQVVVRVSGELRWLGTYDTEEQAGAISAPFFIGIAQ